MAKFTSLFAEGPWGARPGKNNSKKPEPQRPETPSSRPQSGPAAPDLEKLIHDAQEKLKAAMGGGSGGAGGRGGDGEMNPRMFKLFALGAVALWAVSGFYIVAPDEQGVVTRFGAYVTTTGPGPNFHLPWPIESVSKIKVTTENVVQVGFRTETTGGALGLTSGPEVTRDIPGESLMLTGDENIVDLDFTVRWRITGPKEFLFNVADPVQTIRDIAESAMREVIGRHPIDDALGANRGQIQTEVRDLMQRVAADYGLGVEINGVELQQVNPPQEVIDAFRDVQAARADAEKMRNQALGYANDILPRARGEAAQMVQDAEAYKAAKVTEAKGLADRFLNQRAAYAQSPEVAKRRLYVETMEELMGKANVVVMTGQAAGVLPYLPLQSLKAKPQGGQ